MLKYFSVLNVLLRLANFDDKLTIFNETTNKV